MTTVLMPGTLTSLPGRYAKALFDLALEEGQTGSVGAALRTLEKLLQSSGVLKKALANPNLKRHEQALALAEICAQMKAPEIVQSFVKLLVITQRIFLIHKISRIYQNLISQAKGEQAIEVISAYRLTPAQSEMLEGKLKKVFPGTLKLTYINNPKVLGGIMIQIGSRVIDATLVTHLSQLATVMKGNT